MQIAKWGNSLAVRLPAKLVQELNLQSGDEIELEALPSGPGKKVFNVSRKPTREEALARIRALAAAEPAAPGYRFKREDAYPPERGGK